MNTPDSLFLRRVAVAERLLGTRVDSWGASPCPGRHLHTTAEGERHFRILGLRSSDATATCFHTTCREIVDKFNDDFATALMMDGSNIWPWDEDIVDVETYRRRPEILIDHAALASAAEGVLPDVTDMLEWLDQASPAGCDGIHGFLQSIYPNPEDRILIFSNEESQGQVLWGPTLDRSWEDKLRLNSRLGVWYQIQPVDGNYREIQRLVTKHNPKGRTRRSHECISRFEYLLCESDTIDIQAWCRFLAQLPLPIVSISTSGSRSVHALIRVGAKTRREWEDFRYDIEPLLLKYGSDRGALKCGQLSRLPGCLRHGSKDKATKEFVAFTDGPHEQRLLYLCPDADGRSILARHSSME
jgi:hypothetical protein